MHRGGRQCVSTGRPWREEEERSGEPGSPTHRGVMMEGDSRPGGAPYFREDVNGV